MRVANAISRVRCWGLYPAYRYYSGRLYRYFAPSVHKIRWYLFSNQKEPLGVSGSVKSELIVSFTSFPERIGCAAVAAQSLLMQTKKADRLVLWLASEQFPNGNADIPRDLLMLQKYGLTIKWCEDLKSYKKLVPSLIEYPEAVIITADDDLYFQKNFVKTLYSAYLLDPHQIHCHRITKITKEDKAWKAISGGFDTYKYPTFLNKLTGGAGACYPPGCFYADVCKEKIFLNIAPTSDDLWFWLMGVLGGYRCNVAKGNDPNLYYINNSQETALSSVNDCPGGAFFEHFQAILSTYSSLSTTLDNEWASNRIKNSDYRM